MKPTNYLRWLREKNGKMVLEQEWEEVQMMVPVWGRRRPGFDDRGPAPKREWRPVPVVE